MQLELADVFGHLKHMSSSSKLHSVVTMDTSVHVHVMCRYCRSSSERQGIETRQMAAKRGLFHRLHDRLKVTAHETQNRQKNATKVVNLYLHFVF